MTPPSPAALSAQATEPTRLEIAGAQQQVRIDWADGHSSAYPFWYLRGYCPCAVCQGHGQATVFADEVADTTLADVYEVGHYALNLVWQDGHRTGIYALSTLRALCPCDGCRASAGQNHPWSMLPPHRQAPADAEAAAASTKSQAPTGGAEGAL